MVASVELLTCAHESRAGLEILNAMRSAAPVRIEVTTRYRGNCDALMLWGVGRPGHSEARDRHVASGRHAVLWDMGYFGKRREGGGYYRVSIDHQHPQAWLDRTPATTSRWCENGIALREVAATDGRIILIGVGPKSHAFLGTHGWEAAKLDELRKRFPGRLIVFRPKPGRPHPDLRCELDASPTIERALEGAVLVVCRHSNVAIDACIAGVAFECDDGAAAWLRGKPYTPDTRLDFLRRLAWWNWKSSEAAACWRFLLEMIAK